MRRKAWHCASGKTVCLAILLWLPKLLLAEPITLRHTVELALKHATAADISAADEQHASAAYRELRNSYIPQLTAGAGLGWSHGFPLGLEGSAPSLFNINSQSALLNAPLRDFVRAAKTETFSASLRSKDQRNQIIQDTVLSYAELQKWEQRLARLHDTEADTQKMQEAVAERAQEGVDSALDATKARLSLARVRLRIAEAAGAADVLRERLSHLTGLPARGIETEPDSLPALPTVVEDGDAAARAADDSPSVKAAQEHARAQYLIARGEHKGYWPMVDFAAQYALLSKFNNYQNYYIPAKPCPGGIQLCVASNFQQNNATVGVSIRFNLLNASQKARVLAADADALKAKKQAEAARNQASEEVLHLQRSVAQMQAAREVAELELEIAQKNVQSVQTRMDAGTANLHDLDDARSQASERFVSLQDVTFELERSQVALMRATGDLEHWAFAGN